MLFRFQLLLSLFKGNTLAILKEKNKEMTSDKHDASYYAKCMVGGIFACGLTHAAICPLDIVKCRKQVSETNIFNLSILG